jgi:hypothetical protein
MADHNIEGHFRALVGIWEQDPWREFWEDVHLTVESFHNLSIPTYVSDIDLWLACQTRDIILLTANRNDEGVDSLEAAISRHNTPTSLPVFTLANPARFSHDRDYAVKVAAQLLEYLVDIDRYRGVGRIYV